MGGISATTITDMMLASGAYVTVGGVDMGALSGVIRYWVEIEREHPALWGVKGVVSATGSVKRAVPKIAFGMTEWEYQKFVEVWYHLGYSSDANSEKIGAGSVGKLHETGDYRRVEILGSELCDGADVKIIFSNAYVSANPDVELSDREDTVLDIELTGVYLASTPNVFPATLYIEKYVAPVGGDSGWSGFLLALQSRPL